MSPPVALPWHAEPHQLSPAARPVLTPIGSGATGARCSFPSPAGFQGLTGSAGCRTGWRVALCHPRLAGRGSASPSSVSPNGEGLRAVRLIGTGRGSVLPELPEWPHAALRSGPRLSAGLGLGAGQEPVEKALCTPRLAEGLQHPCTEEGGGARAWRRWGAGPVAAGSIPASRSCRDRLPVQCRCLGGLRAVTPPRVLPPGCSSAHPNGAHPRPAGPRQSPGEPGVPGSILPRTVASSVSPRGGEELHRDRGPRVPGVQHAAMGRAGQGRTGPGRPRRLPGPCRALGRPEAGPGEGEAGGSGERHCPGACGAPGRAPAALPRGRHMLPPPNPR